MEDGGKKELMKGKYLFKGREREKPQSSNSTCHFLLFSSKEKKSWGKHGKNGHELDKEWMKRDRF